MNNSYTEDLSEFGYIEKEEARDLINALNDKKTPKDLKLVQNNEIETLD